MVEGVIYLLEYWLSVMFKVFFVINFLGFELFNDVFYEKLLCCYLESFMLCVYLKLELMEMFVLVSYLDIKWCLIILVNIGVIIIIDDFGIGYVFFV